MNRIHRRIVCACGSLMVGLLLGGLLFGRRDDRRNRLPLPVRMASSALVLTNALLLWRSERRAEVRRRVRLPVAAGMACGTLGDLVMARVIPLPHRVLFGIAAFGIGHTRYLAAYRHQAQLLGGARNLSAWRAGSGLVALLSWLTLVRSATVPRVLNYAALLYGLLLATLAGLTARLAAQDRRFGPAAVGGALFLASDMLLASELFRATDFPHIGDAIWLSYIAGQWLLVNGVEPTTW